MQSNLSNSNGADHNFDYGERLRDVVGKGMYMYDAHGRRVRDTVSGLAAHSQYQMSGQLAFSTDSRRGKVREHIYLGDGPVFVWRFRSSVIGYQSCRPLSYFNKCCCQNTIEAAPK